MLSTSISPQEWSAIIATFAFLVSIFALLSTVKQNKRNTRLSIQQAIFKTVSEKAAACNSLWENEPEFELGNINSPHYKVLSEIVISKEVIEKSFQVFKQNDSSITLMIDDFYYLFWKQLRTDLRGWYRRIPDIARSISDNRIIWISTNQHLSSLKSISNKIL